MKSSHDATIARGLEAVERLRIAEESAGLRIDRGQRDDDLPVILIVDGDEKRAAEFRDRVAATGWTGRVAIARTVADAVYMLVVANIRAAIIDPSSASIRAVLERKAIPTCVAGEDPVEFVRKIMEP